MKYFNSHWLLIVTFQIIFGAGCAIAGRDETVADISTYARKFDWVTTAQAAKGSISCESLLQTLRAGKRLHAVLPRISTESPSADALTELASCREYKAGERRNAAVPNNYIQGAADLGDHSFRLYRVKSRSSSVLDVIYAEFDSKKILTNAYVDGFSVIDIADCRILGSLPVQRPLEEDKKTGAARQVGKGLFELDGEILVLTRTEQVGHEKDVESFRAMEAWAVEPTGKFAQICSWSPKSIVTIRKAGE